MRAAKLGVSQREAKFDECLDSQIPALAQQAGKPLGPLANRVRGPQVFVLNVFGQSEVFTAIAVEINFVLVLIGHPVSGLIDVVGQKYEISDRVAKFASALMVWPDRHPVTFLVRISRKNMFDRRVIIGCNNLPVGKGSVQAQGKRPALAKGRKPSKQTFVHAARFVLGNEIGTEPTAEIDWLFRIYRFQHFAISLISLVAVEHDQLHQKP